MVLQIHHCEQRNRCVAGEGCFDGRALERPPWRRAKPIAALLELGLSLPASACLEQELVRREFKSTLNRIFQDVDLIICPSMSVGAIAREGEPESDQAEQDLAQTLRFTAPFDYSGSPTLSVPWTPGRQRRAAIGSARGTGFRGGTAGQCRCGTGGNWRLCEQSS